MSIHLRMRRLRKARAWIALLGHLEYQGKRPLKEKDWRNLTRKLSAPDSPLRATLVCCAGSTAKGVSRARAIAKKLTISK